MKAIEKILCKFIGWNATMLNECGEASHGQLKKLSGALMLMLLMWAVIGYTFANNFLGIESLIGKLAMAAGFAFVVWIIERIIILTVGKPKLMMSIRVVLAILMAIFGSVLIDQCIFRNDIQEALETKSRERIENEIQSRTKTINDELTRLESEREKLIFECDSIIKEISEKPVLTTRVPNVKKIPVNQADGTTTIKTEVEYSTVVNENPLWPKYRNDSTMLADCNSQIEALSQRRINLVEDVTQEIQEKPMGFLTEFIATINVISQSIWSIMLYAVLFLILMSIETFVVSIKAADTKCDYEAMIEKQLRGKLRGMEEREKAALRA